MFRGMLMTTRRARLLATVAATVGLFAAAGPVPSDGQSTTHGGTCLGSCLEVCVPQCGPAGGHPTPVPGECICCE